MPEVVSARCFKTMRGKIPQMEERWPYVTAYEFEFGDLAKFSIKLAASMQTLAPTLDRSWSGNLITIQISGYVL